MQLNQNRLRDPRKGTSITGGAHALDGQALRGNGAGIHASTDLTWEPALGSPALGLTAIVKGVRKPLHDSRGCYRLQPRPTSPWNATLTRSAFPPPTGTRHRVTVSLPSKAAKNLPPIATRFSTAPCTVGPAK
jgi:hypothetical protein